MLPDRTQFIFSTNLTQKDRAYDVYIHSHQLLQPLTWWNGAHVNVQIQGNVMYPLQSLRKCVSCYSRVWQSLDFQ